MNGKYYKLLKESLTMKVEQIKNCSSDDYREKYYYDYFYNLGTNKTLSAIIISLLNASKLSDEDLSKLFYLYHIAHIMNVSASVDIFDSLRAPLFVSMGLSKDRVKLLTNRVSADANEQIIEIGEEKKQNKKIERNNLTRDDIYFLIRINNLIKDEIIELEHASKNNVLKNNNKLTDKSKLKDSKILSDNKVLFKNQALIIGERVIDFRRKQNQSSLLATLFKRPKNNYFYLDILDDWGEEFEKGKSWRKIYTAGDEINKSVAIETGIKDFIIKDTKQIQINPKYI